MNSQKFENMLNLALDTPEQERVKTKALNVGFDEITNTWDVIVRYNDSIDFLKDLGIAIVYLAANYAILTVPEPLVKSLSSYRQIIYVEMPKSLYFSATNGVRESCINEVQSESFSRGKSTGGLFGEGVICAVIDSGIDYSHPAFLNEDKSTRILEIWDQSIQGNPPKGYNLGSIYTADQINEANKQTTNQAKKAIVPSVDLSGHGTHVAGIMAGNFAEDKRNNVGIATKSPLLIVKLNTSTNNGFPRTTELMQAIDFVYKTAIRYNMPVSINISFGNTYGSHDGTSLLEMFINSISNLWKMVICIGTGNEGNASGHSLHIYKNNERKLIEFGVASFESNLNLQIWKAYEDLYSFEVLIPNERGSIKINNITSSFTYRLGSTTLLVYYGEPSPYSPYQEIFMEFIPTSANVPYLTSGVWQIDVTALKVVTGRIDMWLPDSASLNNGTAFLEPDPTVTLTIPSTSSAAISVGAYNALSFSYADFSGRGFTRLTNQVRPDIVAPGVNIVSAAPGGGLTSKSGTSMATPFVSGSAALLMEWGIVLDNDPYLYGEKVKSYFIRGARNLPGFTQYPNPQLGFGALCVANSLPR